MIVCLVVLGIQLLRRDAEINKINLKVAISSIFSKYAENFAEETQQRICPLR